MCASVAADQGAEQRFGEAHQLAVRVGDQRGAGWALQHLAWISFVEGRSAEAESRLLRSAETFAELDDDAVETGAADRQDNVLKNSPHPLGRVTASAWRWPRPSPG